MRIGNILYDHQAASFRANLLTDGLLAQAVLAAVTDTALMTADDVYVEQYLWTRAWRAELAMLLGA